MKKSFCLAVVLMVWSPVYADDYICVAPKGTTITTRTVDLAKSVEDPIVDETSSKISEYDFTVEAFVDGDEAIVVTTNEGGVENHKFNVSLEKRGRVIMKWHSPVNQESASVSRELWINVNENKGQWKLELSIDMNIGDYRSSKQLTTIIPLDCAPMVD